MQKLIFFALSMAAWLCFMLPNVVSTKDELAMSSTSTLLGEGSAEPLFVHISEIMIAPPSGEKEWIEVFRDGGIDELLYIDIYDGVGMVTSSVGIQKGYTVFEISKAVLNNSGDAVEIRGANGDVFDQIVYGEWGNVSTTVALPPLGQTLAKDLVTNMWHSTDPTKGASNIFLATTTDVVSETDGLDFSGRLLINEFVSDPADTEVEFVELHNPTTTTIPLLHWFLVDGSGTTTTLGGHIEPLGFYVIEKPKGGLNNAGDEMVLWYKNMIIDHVMYGGWDGLDEENAPVAQDPYAVARQIDGLDSDVHADDFFVTTVITKGYANVIVSPVGEDISFGTVVISELFANPTGSDLEGEFIELFNTGVEPVNLSQWQLGDTSTKRYTLANQVIAPGGYLVVYRRDSGISLNNGEETVYLFAPNGAEADSVWYESAPEQLSLIYIDGALQWSMTQTPGAENIHTEENMPPEIVLIYDEDIDIGQEITFDARETVDPEGDPLVFRWLIDGVSYDGSVIHHTFFLAGKKSISITVNDGYRDVTEMIKLNVRESELHIDTSIEQGSILITEIFPNPSGPDDGEFIEVTNNSETDIDVSGWYLDDGEGGSRPYQFPVGTILPAGQLVVYDRAETGISLNNTDDVVRLVYPDKKTVYTELSYGDALVAASYILAGESWVWTMTPTPGEINLLTELSIIEKKEKGEAVSISLNALSEMDIGDKVQVSGVVTVLPGTFANTYFYLQDELRGVQIYMRSKQFPALAIGDTVSVTGVVAANNGDIKVSVKDKNDIVKHASVKEVVPYIVESVGVISEALSGMLISVEGDIIDVRGTYAYLDDGIADIKVSFKKQTDIQSKQMKNSISPVRITGIVVQSKDELMVLPRSQADIVMLETEKTDIADSVHHEKTPSIKSTSWIIALGSVASASIVALRRHIRQLDKKEKTKEE